MSSKANKDKRKKEESMNADNRLEVEECLVRTDKPFVFEQDKKLVEELSHRSKYIRSVFST